MEVYPEEFRTPPIPLVCLVGIPELHSTISSFLHSEQPPINVLALPDFSKTYLFRRLQSVKTYSGLPAGILKRDWLSKHRTRIPSVVAAFFNSADVSGDPTQWLQVCTDLDNVKAICQARSIRLVLVLVQATSSPNISEDRVVALKKRADIDQNYLVIFSQNDASQQQDSFIKLAAMFSELSRAYYKDHGRRVLNQIEKTRGCSIEMNIRYYFKVAVYAEFRKDWPEALRFYQEGYNALPECTRSSARLPPIQHVMEIKAVAEHLHFKVVTLLFVGGKTNETTLWFWKHIEAYKKLTGSADVLFLHWAWLSRQFLVFAELLESSSLGMQNAIYLMPEKNLEWHSHPAYFYQLAASYLRKKQHCFHAALSALDTLGDLYSANTTLRPESVVPSVYIGQVASCCKEGETLVVHIPSDEEYVKYIFEEGKKCKDVNGVIALLKKSREFYSKLNAHRISAYCAGQMAQEYFETGDFSNAKQIFEGLAEHYRKEGWIVLLWEVLSYLRKCSKELCLGSNFIEYSLEMSSLPVHSGVKSIEGDNLAGHASLLAREKMQLEVIEFLKSKFDIFRSTFKLPFQSFHLEIDHVSPLRTAVLVSVAAHDQAITLNAPAIFTLSLLSHLPLPVDIDQLEVHFNQQECNFLITNSQNNSSVDSSCQDHGLRIEMVQNLTLLSNRWLRLTYTIFPGNFGKLECLSVTAKIGQQFTICCKAESPASMEDLPLWKLENQMETFPSKDPCLSLSGQRFIQVEEPESPVELTLNSFGSPLVGENFAVSVRITSRTTLIISGQLKINLVDVKSSGFVSPRDLGLPLPDNIHVDLRRVSVLKDDEKNVLDLGNVKQSFGLVSVPDLSEGKSWFCEIEMTWNMPKTIMLYVSLGYLPVQDRPAQRIHIHRSLQIEGKLPLSIKHHFMPSFRREVLLLSTIQLQADFDRMCTLAVNESSTLIVIAQNCTEVPLQLISATVDVESDVTGPSWDVKPSDLLENTALIAPGEEFRWVFSVVPLMVDPRLNMGSVVIKWSRPKPNSDASAAEVTTEYKISEVTVENPLLVVILESPPHAVLGIPFVFGVRIRNHTHLLQEISYCLLDTPHFVLSGPNNGIISILPHSDGILNYRLVSLTSGKQQLPQITLICDRYCARLQLAGPASDIFVFPSHQQFEMIDHKVI